MQAFATTVIIFTIGAAMAEEIEFKVNPNKLPLCPKPDMRKKIDMGIGGRTEKWSNCWGRYRIELAKDFKGDVYEGEFKDGLPNGHGSETFISGHKYIGEFKNNLYNGQGAFFHANGDKYVGEFKNGLPHGQGTSTFGGGNKYVGEYKSGNKHGLGINSFADGRRQEGIWENDNFIREAKVNLPSDNNNVSNNTDRTDIDDATLTFYDYASRLGIKVEVNPNNLKACPQQDKTKTKFDFQRHAKWHNCWGKYEVELDKQNKGDIFEGEWIHGFLDGIGSYTSGDEKKKYVGEFLKGKFHGNGILINRYKTIENGNFVFLISSRYAGNFRDGAKSGHGVHALSNGNKYEGDFSNDSFTGQGIMTFKDGRRIEGIWENDKFIREAKVNLPHINDNVAKNTGRTEIDREREQLANERQRLEQEKLEREKAKKNQRLDLQITATKPTADGSYNIVIQTNVDTASLKINGEELGGSADGRYTINRFARAGQETKLEIVAKDVYGNTDTKIVTVSRPFAESKPQAAALNPAQVKKQTSKDAVAIIIGIADYKNLPRADFANDDARVFYDYAIRALGIKSENIKLLVDTDADDVAIYRAFKTWLPSRVRASTDVYVYYSGHGLPTADGQGLYVLPQRADRDFIDKTAITQAEINAAIQAAKPKSVTVFLDSCYSGQARSGETLIASARPVALKAEKQLFPQNFTVITASQSDQISSSSPDLKHGIFSYYLMRGMEGDADADRDGRITAGEMHAYLSEQVVRQAGMQNRVQQPQLIGDVNRVLVGQ